MQRDTGTRIYIYCKKTRLVYRLSRRIYYTVIYYMLTGDVCSGTLQSRSMDSLGQQFLDLLDQASWCHAGMARSSWLHRCGMGCHRLWCRGILLNSWHGRNSWSMFHLGCQCCRCRRCGLHAWCRWG